MNDSGNEREWVQLHCICVYFKYDSAAYMWLLTCVV